MNTDTSSSPAPTPAHDRQRPEEKRRVEISRTEARAGVTGHNVRYVLGFGLAAVVIAFAVILYYALHMQ